MSYLNRANGYQATGEINSEPVTVVFTNEVEVTLMDYMGSDQSIVTAARVSTMGSEASAPEKLEGLIGYLMRNRHGSPFEHGCMTFRVKAPIFVWREHHRHRIGFSYNEESGRYKELEPLFYMPAIARTQQGKAGHYDIAEDSELDAYMKAHIERSAKLTYQSYTKMLHHGIAREVARMCLPVNIMSTCFVTCNPRSLMNFLSLRVDSPQSMYPSKPQREIEMVAEQYEMHMSRLFPLTYQAFLNAGRVAP